LVQGLSSGLTALQDFDTLRKGFIKLRDKYTQSTATVSVLENELNACRGESEQLRVQATALQEELRVQTETTANKVASATSALRTVRVNVPERSPQWVYLSMDLQEVHCVADSGFRCQLRRFP
jgi:hypothetical protein